MRLPDFSVKYPVATLMLFLGVIVLGLFSLSLLPVDMFPEVDPPVVSILTAWPGASASDVETEVTKRIEDEVNGVNNLDELTSRSVDGLSAVACKFDWGTDLDSATNDVRDRLEMVRRKLPDDVDAPVLYKFSSATAPVMVVSVTAGVNWPQLHHLTDKRIADELRRVPGVGAIVVYGGLRRRINVYFDSARLEGYGLPLHRINQVLAAQNVDLPAGSSRQGALEYFIRVPGRYTSVEELKRTVIGSHRGRPLRLEDVAHVEDAFKPEDLAAWESKSPAIVLMVQKQTGRNTVAVVEGLRTRIAELNTQLPSDVQVKVMMDNASNIVTNVRNLRMSLLWGIALVILVSLVFLRRFRSALIVAMAIPFSLIVSFVLMYFNRYSINMVTLMSLAIASGMVVDNAIVVLENIVRHVERGARPSTAARFGAAEMGPAITASTATTVVVFLPMMFLTGLVGVIFKQLAFVVTVTLAASLLTALSMTPMLSSRWLQGRKPEKERTAGGAPVRLYDRSERGFQRLDRMYGRLVAWCLDHKSAVLALVGATVISAATMIPFLSTSFLPEVDSGDVSVDFRLEEGVGIEHSRKVVERVIDDIMGLVRKEEFQTLYAWCGQSEQGIGLALGMDEAPNAASLGFKLVDREKRDRSAQDIARLLRERLEKIPGITRIKVLAVDPAGAILAGQQSKPLVVEVQGPDLEANLAAAEKLAERMRRVPGMVDVSVSQKDPRPELWVEVKRDKIGLAGLTAGEVGRQLRNYLYGFKAAEYRDGGDNYDIFTRFTEEDKDRLELLPQAPIFTADGRTLRLKDLAEISERHGPIEIERKNLERVVRVEAGLLGMSLGQGRHAAQEVMDALDPAPGGTRLSFGGEVEEQRKAFADLTLLLALGILLTYMVMAALFGNFRDPFIIMFSVPFALVGVIYAFRLTGVTLGIISFMGVVMLMGIVVNNAIVLVDYIKLLQARGMDLKEAVVQGGRDRLRPVLMTTLTTFFGMLPMAVSRGTGAEVFNPLGITMLGGLTVSALVSLVLIPVVYHGLEGRRQRRAAV